jgi:hypothetical protein
VLLAPALLFVVAVTHGCGAHLTTGRISPLAVIYISGWQWASQSMHVYSSNPFLFVFPMGCILTDSVVR